MRSDDKTQAVHPIEPLVLQAFAERAAHDGASLAYFLAGAHVRGASKAYTTVARDVLGCMHAQGKLTRDECGWFRLPPREG
jgi:hypothetical protein